MLVSILNGLLAVVLIYLSINSFYNFIFGLTSALKPKQATKITEGKKHKIAVIIPG